MKIGTLLGAVAVLSAGCVTPGASPHAMSASRHEDAATTAQKDAELHQRQYAPDEVAQRDACLGPPLYAKVQEFDLSYPCWVSVVNPTQSHREEAAKLRDAAAQHRAASRALAEAESLACAGVAPLDRDISPFFHREDIARVEVRGSEAIVFFRPVRGLTAERLQRQIDCHLARNASLGHDLPEMAYCPLVPRTVAAIVGAGPKGLNVTLGAREPSAAAEVMRRAGALVPGV